MSDEQTWIEQCFALMEQGLDAGLSYYEAAAPAVGLIKRLDKSSEFMEEYGARALADLYRARNHSQRQHPPESSTQGPSRMNVASLRGGVFSRFYQIDDRNYRLGDLTKELAGKLAAKYRQQSEYHERHAAFWSSVAKRLKPGDKIATRFEENAFAKKLKELGSDE